MLHSMRASYVKKTSDVYIASAEHRTSAGYVVQKQGEYVTYMVSLHPLGRETLVRTICVYCIVEALHGILALADGGTLV